MEKESPEEIVKNAENFCARYVCKRITFLVQITKKGLDSPFSRKTHIKHVSLIVVF